MGKKKPLEILKEIRRKRPKIAVLGAGMTDYWYLGRYSCPSQESKDITVFDVDSDFTQEGGARAVCENLHVVTHLLPERYTVGDTQKHRFFDRNGKKIVFRADLNKEQPIVSVRNLSLTSSNIVISDYGKGLLDWPAILNFAQTYRHAKVIFSPHVRLCAQYSEAISDCSLESLLDWTWVINQDELHALVEQGFVWSEKLGHCQIVTGGQYGVNISYSNALGAIQAVKYPVKPIETCHTVAIGDAFLAAFAAAHFTGFHESESVVWAIECCRISLVTNRLGTHYLREEDFERWR